MDHTKAESASSGAVTNTIKLRCSVSTSPPMGVRSILISVSVCLSVCLSAWESQKSQVQISPNFLYMLSVDVTRVCSDGNAICYGVICGWRHVFIIMEAMSNNQRRRVYFVQFARWRHPGRSLPFLTASWCDFGAFIQVLRVTYQ